MPTVANSRKKKPSKKPARGKSADDAELASWTKAKKKRVLQILVREFLQDGSGILYVRGVGIVSPTFGPARLVKLDDSTPHMRELQRRMETLDDSVPIEEIIADRKQRAKNQE